MLRVSRIQVALAAIAAIAVSSVAAAQTPSGPQPQIVRRMPSAPPPAFVGERGEARLDLSSGAPVVDVTIQGRTYKFLIDTGAGGHGRIKGDIAQAMGLAVIGQMQAGDGSGAVQTRRRFALPSLTVAGVTLQNMEISELPATPGRALPFDGVIGLHALANHLVTLDYAQAKLTLGRDQLPDTAIRYDGSQGGVRFPIRIGAVDAQVSLDTGNTLAPLIVPTDFVATLQTRGEARAAGRGRTAISSVDIREQDLVGQVTVAGAVLPVTTVTVPSLGPTGNLGSLALRNAVVRLDQRNSRLQISPGAQ